MAVSVELGRRQQGGGVRYSGGRQGLQGRARAGDREGRAGPRDTGGQGQAARTEFCVESPAGCCLIGSIAACRLGLLSLQRGGKELLLDPQGSMGPKGQRAGPPKY